MNPVSFAGKEFNSTEVIEKLVPQVTEERWAKIQQVVDLRNKSLCTVMEGIYDKGNTSAVMRSAEAFGYYQFHHIELQEKFKESKRVTKGADKWLLQKKWSDTKSCIQNLKDEGFKIYVTHLENGRPIEDLDFSGPVALCFGNELKGASPELTDLADERVFLPMNGFVQSFNISVAAALCYYHIHKEHKKGHSGQLSPAEKEQLWALYLLKSSKNPELYL